MSRLETNADKAYYHDLPKVSFRVITDDKSLLAPAGVHSEQSRSYGYNDFSLFERPEHYIRYIEPIESELAVQVEYDMDEQDQEWLDRVNAERKKDQSGPVSYEIFEIIMDKLEKEWFHLIKRIPQPVTHMPVEDSKCSICDDGEGENSNAIVFCDGCNLAVHQDCYGVPYIPEGQWLCRKCTVSPENPVSCLFCPNEGGAFKQTSTGHWAHLLCAIWIPELGVGNAIYMEPVDGVEQVPKNRWKLVCSLCKDKVGACIQCDNRNCFTAFHVTCARQAGLLMSMKSINADGQLRAFCDKHMPAERKKEQDADEDDEDDDSYRETNDDEEEDEDDEYGTAAPTAKLPVAPPKGAQPRGRGRPRKRPLSPPPHVGTSSTAAPAAAASTPQPRTVTTKTARAHAKSYRPGPPIVPHAIVQKLMDYIGKVTIRKKAHFVERLCRYWSLKREARRGAPLLKRLHLEPWTASNTGEQQTDAEKAKKLQFLTQLRNDLEKVRMLAEQARKREKEKLRAAQLIKDVVDSCIFPHYAILSLTLQKIRAMDRSEMFLQPVSRVEVPDYYEVIKEPMCWAVIEDKIERNIYVEIADFKRDVRLVVDNAMLYNKSETPFHRTAARIKKNAQPLLDELDSLSESSAFRFSDVVDSDSDDEVRHEPGPSSSVHVGDLEPSDLLLRSLLLPDTDEPSRDLLGSIFTFELERPRMPTPPREPKKKSARSSLSSKQRWEEREAKRKEMSVAGLPRSTRATRAIVDAFAHEAGIEATSGGALTPAATGSEEGPGSVDAEAAAQEETERAGLVTPRASRSRVATLAASGRSGRSDRSSRHKRATPSTSKAEPNGAGDNGEADGQVAAKGEATVDDNDSDDDDGSEDEGEGSPAIKPLSRPQRGVAGIQSVNVLSDRERRERERGLDLVAETIDSREQYSRFNIGWILPEGQKRRRAETSTSTPGLGGGTGPGSSRALERSVSVKQEVGAKSGKRASTGPVAARTRTGKAETNTEDAEAAVVVPPQSRKRKYEVGSSLSPPPDEENDDNDDGDEDGENGMDVDDDHDGEGKSKSGKEKERSKRRSGRFVPAPAAKRRRVEKERGDEAGEAAGAGNGEDENEEDELTPVPEPKGRKGGKTVTEQEEEERQDVDEEEEEERVQPAKKQVSKSSAGKKSGPKPELGFGSVVWAKVPSYPYFPAEIVDPDSEDPIIPDSVLEMQGETSGGGDGAGEEHLVRFFDKTRSFAWVGKERLVSLGGGEDVKYLAGKNFRSSSMKKSCQAAHRAALAAKAAQD